MGSDKIFMFDNPAAGIAQSMGMSRVERRKMKRKYEKRR